MKKLELGGGLGDRKTEYLMIGVLVLIIAAAVTFTVLRFTGDGPESTKRQFDELKYKCMECGHEFTYDPKSQDEVLLEEDMALGCPSPSCEAKESCLKMIRCPNPKCGKYYVPQDAKFILDVHRGAADRSDKMPGRVCPHCRTDWNEYMKQEYLRRKGQ